LCRVITTGQARELQLCYNARSRAHKRTLLLLLLLLLLQECAA
jgi:hypothetical protein